MFSTTFLLLRKHATYTRIKRKLYNFFMNDKGVVVSAFLCLLKISKSSLPLYRGNEIYDNELLLINSV